MADREEAFAERLGMEIRVARVRKGLSQKELAHFIGISAPYLSEIERGRTNVSAVILHRLATELGVRTGEFFGED